MNDQVSQVLDGLTRVAGVRGALVLDAQAGVPVAHEFAEDVGAPGLAALAALAFRHSARAVDSASFGELRTLELESPTGHVIVAGGGELLVVVLAEPDAQLGMVRVEARRGAEALR